MGKNKEAQTPVKGRKGTGLGNAGARRKMVQQSPAEDGRRPQNASNASAAAFRVRTCRSGRERRCSAYLALHASTMISGGAGPRFFGAENGPGVGRIHE